MPEYAGDIGVCGDSCVFVSISTGVLVVFVGDIPCRQLSHRCHHRYVAANPKVAPVSPLSPVMSNVH